MAAPLNALSGKSPQVPATDTATNRKAAMVTTWRKRIREILNQTIAAADAVSEKLFLSAERPACYRNELFAIREGILELMARLREQ